MFSLLSLTAASLEEVGRTTGDTGAKAEVLAAKARQSTILVAVMIGVDVIDRKEQQIMNYGECSSTGEATVGSGFDPDDARLTY